MPDHCIDQYFDDLLTPPAAEATASDTPTGAPADPAGYRLVSLGGLKLLLPPEFGDRLLSQPAEPNDLRLLDIRSALFPTGHPALTREPAPGCWLPVPKQGVQLWFEADAGTIDVDADSIAWRHNPQTRPWLRGTVAAHKAAIIDPEALAVSAGAAPTGEADG